MIDTHIHLGNFSFHYFYGLKSTIKQIQKIYKDYDGICVIPASDKQNKIVAASIKELQMPAKFIVWAEPNDYNTIKDMAFSGIKIHPAYTGFSILDPRFNKIIELAEERGVPIICHSGDVESTKYNHIIIRAREYRNVKFIIGHMGGKRYQNTWNCPIDAKTYPNIFIDTTMKIKGHFIENCQKEVGSKRMLFGSDFPIMHPSVGIEAIKTADVNFEDITHNVAHKLFFE